MPIWAAVICVPPALEVLVGPAEEEVLAVELPLLPELELLNSELLLLEPDEPVDPVFPNKLLELCCCCPNEVFPTRRKAPANEHAAVILMI